MEAPPLFDLRLFVLIAPMLQTEGNHRVENYRVGVLCAYGLAVDLLAILWLQ